MAELYNEGLIREGLLRTTNLVLPGLISKFDTIEEFLTRFAVNGVEAALALDFIGGEYRTANTSTTFADAFTGTSPKLTYSTAAGSNSTMTQGYGPELVTDFSTYADQAAFDVDWTRETGWTFSGGVASKAAGTASWLTTSQVQWANYDGKVLQVTWDVSNSTAGSTRPRWSGQAEYGNGTFTQIVVVGYTGSNFGINADASFNGDVSNISVREAPKIVWAPHNLLDYSEDFSQLSVFVKDPDVQIGTTNNDDPAGGQTATQINVSGSGRIYANVTSGDYFTSVYIKPGTFSNFRLAGFFIDLGVTPPTNSDPNGSIDVLPNNWFRVTVGYVGARPFQIQAYPDASYAVHTQSGDYQIWGAHVYRSDLGGMHPVPQAATGFEYYVPTNGNAEYLPRVGHHVYNGSAWVNEGLLIESEPRTNLVTYSDFSGGSINPAGIKSGGFVPNSASGPDGATSATVLIEDTSTGVHRLNVGGFSITSGVVYTASVYVKPNGRSEVRLIENATTGAYASFNVETGAIVSSGSGGSGLIEDAGGGWYRCAMTFTSTGTAGRIDVTIQSSGSVSYTGDDTSGLYLYGLQLDQGQVVNGTPVDAPTPSSYMPTSGGTYTRTAQSLEVPPAQFGWPEPEYIGSELVTDFSTYADQTAFDVDWTRGTGWTFDAANDTADCDGTQASRSSLYQALLTVGKVYEFSMEVTAITAGNVRLRNGIGAGEVYIADQDAVGVYTGIATVVGGVTLVVDADANFVGSVSNISVREINPLSVSIQMDGRMTYADEDATGTVIPYRWFGSDAGGNAYTQSKLRTDGTNTGKVAFEHRASGTFASEASASDAYSPGINVPFNISSRHGSTFVNGAVDGVALTADTTPTALPDLSSTDLQIAYDFMGTIGTFRQFAGDIGDTGLVTATNPSTEPTLSLTFNGTAGGSFYNLSWSE